MTSYPFKKAEYLQSLINSGFITIEEAMVHLQIIGIPWYHPDRDKIEFFDTQEEVQKRQENYEFEKSFKEKLK